MPSFLNTFEFELSELYMIIDQTVVISVILMVKPLWYYMLFFSKITFHKYDPYSFFI